MYKNVLYSLNLFHIYIISSLCRHCIVFGIVTCMSYQVGNMVIFLYPLNLIIKTHQLFDFRNCIISSDDSKLLNNSMMLIYNLCLYNNNFRLDVLKDVDIVQKIMEHWTRNEIEYRWVNNAVEII